MNMGPGKHGAQTEPRPLPELIKTAASATLALLARSSETVMEARLLAVDELYARDHQGLLHVPVEALWEALMTHPRSSVGTPLLWERAQFDGESSV